MNNKDKVHVLLTLTAYDSEGNVLGYKDMSHLYSPRILGSWWGAYAIVARFGIPTMIWFGRETRRKESKKATMELSCDGEYAAREYVRTKRGWKAKADPEVPED